MASFGDAIIMLLIIALILYFVIGFGVGATWPLWVFS